MARQSLSGNERLATNALENLNQEFRRRTKTRASFSTEEAAVTLLFRLPAFGQKLSSDASMGTGSYPSYWKAGARVLDLNAEGWRCPLGGGAAVFPRRTAHL